MIRIFYLLLISLVLMIVILFNSIFFGQNSYSQRSILLNETNQQIIKNDDLKKCPDYWGGYSFTPYYFEFWEGHESRLNKREVYEKSDDSWKHLILQP